MARCILHAGMPRTGAGSIQASLRTLDDTNFLYAPFAGFNGFPDHSAALVNLYTPPEDPRHQAIISRVGLEKFNATVAAASARMQAAISAAGTRDLILSGEAMSQMSTLALGRMKAELACHYSDFTVIAYVRPPLSHIERAFQQALRTGHANLGRLSALWPNYASTLGRLDEVFGAGNVMLVKYDDARFPEGDVVADFCQRAGIPAASVRPVQHAAVLTRTAARLLYQYELDAKAGKAEPLSLAQYSALADLLNGLDPVPFQLAPTLLEPLLAGRESDLAWMEMRLGENLAETPAAAAGAISSAADLVAPVKDAAASIARLITETGGKVRETDRTNVSALLGALAGLVQPEHDQARRKAAGAPAGGTMRYMPQADIAMARPDAGQLQPMPVKRPPEPLINKDKNLMVLWSPKSACTTVYVWFSHVSGFSDAVRRYHSWPHNHRMERYLKSELYFESARSGMPDASPLKIMRDPYSRAVSIYRHALQFPFADAPMAAWSGGKFSAERGYSFQTFLDLLESFDMNAVNVHFRPQFHVVEKERKLGQVINISRTDLFKALNDFEEEQNLPRTNFADLHWMHNLESKRRAKQEPIEGGAHDDEPFSRRDVAVLGRFPSYAQLLTPRARQRIEALYKVDFDAYGPYL